MTLEKFTDTKIISEWQVLSDSGYINIEYIGKTVNYTKHFITKFGLYF